jgi:hypothetical protein
MRIPILYTLLILTTLTLSCSRPTTESPTGVSPQGNGGALQTASPSGSAPQFDDPKQAALRALSNLGQLLAVGQNYSAMGFDSPEQVSQATLGDPISVYNVGIDQLRDYTGSSDPDSLLVDTHRLSYPVIAAGHGRTLITVEMKNGKWQFVSFGDQSVARNLVRVRNDKASAPGGSPATKFFMVRVKALFLTFLADRVEGTGLRLVPLNASEELKLSPAFRDNHAFLTENPNFNAEKEGSKKAQDVFAGLADAAKKTDSSKPF